MCWKAGRIPRIDELPTDDAGNSIISELDPDLLSLSSQWESNCLTSMGEHCEIVSYGFNLEENQ